MRAVLVLHYYVGMPASAVAETLDIPMGTRSPASIGRSPISAPRSRPTSGRPSRCHPRSHETARPARAGAHGLVHRDRHAADARLHERHRPADRELAATRRWTSPERWLPRASEFRRRKVPPFPWRTVAVLVALFALLVASLVLYAGSQERLPPPFGLARNGLVAYSKDGDIFTVDPATGSRRFVTSGDEADDSPRWSPDGTRLAFVRGTLAAPPEGHSRRGGSRSSIRAERHRGERAARGHRSGRVRMVARRPLHRRRRPGLFIVDVADGASSAARASYQGLDVHWRPGHPSELLFRGETEPRQGLVVVDVNDPRSARLVAADGDEVLRPNGWTVDGQRIIYTYRNPG